MSAMSSKLDLFGGAITVQAPPLIDASDLRQVPDTQEVFMYPQSSVSIVVEILQRVEETDPSAAARFHFDSLAHDNSAVRSHVESTRVSSQEPLPGTPAPILLTGVQEVPKFNQPGPDTVYILMALYRVDYKPIDLVVTFNVPTRSHDGGAVDEEGKAKAERDFNEFAHTLRIVDPKLFA